MMRRSRFSVDVDVKRQRMKRAGSSDLSGGDESGEKSCSIGAFEFEPISRRSKGKGL